MARAYSDYLCNDTQYDQVAAGDVTYDPAPDPSTRCLLHEVEISFTQNDGVDVYLSNVRHRFCVQCVR